MKKVIKKNSLEFKLDKIIRLSKYIESLENAPNHLLDMEFGEYLVTEKYLKDNHNELRKAKKSLYEMKKRLLNKYEK